MLKRTEPNPSSVAALVALSTSGKHVYGGTVPEGVVARRRAKNKAARRSRRINRRAV